MHKLHQLFISTASDIGFSNTDFPMAVFYNTPVGIRFEIGGDEDIYLPNDEINLLYIDRAFQRAKTLYDSLPHTPNILRIDFYPAELKLYNSITLDRLNEIGLSTPDEIVEETRFDDDGDSYVQQHLYWNLTTDFLKADKLLQEIVKGDLGGFNNLCSSVFFLNSDDKILYYLYDDRGLDVVAKDKDNLRTLFAQYSEWILEYDREKIEELFQL